MNKLEELRKAAVQARANWQWDELRRIEQAIAAEDGSLVLAAQNLPAAEEAQSPSDGWGTSRPAVLPSASPDAEATLPSVAAPDGWGSPAQAADSDSDEPEDAEEDDESSEAETTSGTPKPAKKAKSGRARRGR